MNRNVLAGRLTATAFAAALAAWSLSVGLEPFHLHGDGDAVTVHRHVHTGLHQHADLPAAPDPEEDEERESRQATFSSLDSGTPLPPGAIAVAPVRGTGTDPGPVVAPPFAKAEPRSSGGPRAPPR